MKKTVCRLVSVAFLLVVPAAALAQTSIDSTSIVRFYQDNRPGFTDRQVAPVTEFLGLDSDKLADGNLSLHFYGWGRLDLDKKSFNDERADGNLTYGYLQYRFKPANAQIKAGRFFVNEGIVNEQVDGLGVHTDLPYGFGVTTFGGATVHTAHLPGENNDGKGEALYGGRLNYRYGGMLELGLSGVYETKAHPLSNVNNVALLNGGFFGDHRLIGGDIWLSPVRMVEVMGHTSYNTETSGVAEHTYLLNVKPIKHLVLTGEFNEHRERNFFFSSVMFSSLLSNLNEKSRSVGGMASYEVGKGVELTGDYKHYTRDIGNADRMGGDLRLNMKDNTVRSGLSYHYLRAGSEFAIIPANTTSSSYQEVRGWAMHETKGYFASADAIGYFFKERINNKKSAWEVIGSLGYHITPALALSGDLSYGKNPQFIDDLKGLVRLTYNYTAKGGAK
jgi:hypothetical protein